MKRIVLFATGGTISMRVDPATGAAVPLLTGEQILEQIPFVRQLAEIEVRNICRVGGSQVTPALILDLAEAIDAALADDGYDGAIVTQGTDTVEEAAYLLDLLIRTDKPVVHTAAMRNNSEPGPDGPRNLASAIRVAAADESHGHGVLVAMNEEVFAAGDVVKLDTLNCAAFSAPGRGPIGYVMRQRVVFFHRSLIRQKLPTRTLESNVPILKFAAGMDGTLVRAVLGSGARGLVIEGAGAANFPEAAETDLLAAVRAGLPVVLTSRSPYGLVDDVYGYPGAGHRLRSAGAILGQGLNAVKARLKLMAALGSGQSLDEIRAFFEYLY